MDLGEVIEGLVESVLRKKYEDSIDQWERTEEGQAAHKLTGDFLRTWILDRVHLTPAQWAEVLLIAWQYSDMLGMEAEEQVTTNEAKRESNDLHKQLLEWRDDAGKAVEDYRQEHGIRWYQDVTDNEGNYVPEQGVVTI
jgi:hypothetical protein